MTETRRRGAELEVAILDAGWEQLVEGGYDGFTFEAVADRAGTGKAVLYRRWPDKEALLLAVLAHWLAETPVEVPDTGSLRGDVLALLRSLNGRLGDSGAALFSTILGAYFHETETTPAQLRAQVLGDRTQSMTEIVGRAIERGELSGALSARVMGVPIDLLRHEFLMNLRRVPDGTLVDIVDSVFLPLATDPRRGALG